MKTRNVLLTEWDADDIKAGMYVIKNSSPIGTTDLGFARTVTYKIGWNCKGDKSFGMIACLTDGMFFSIGDKYAMVDHLNDDEFGYRPLTKPEYLEMFNDSMQGFY